LNRKETSTAPKEVGKTDLQEGKEVRLSKRKVEELLEERTTYIRKEAVQYTSNKNLQGKEKGLFYRTCRRLKYCGKGVLWKKEKGA
jgi:hypothetical protein